MKTFDYIKNIIKVIAWPILLGIGQFFIILIFSYSFNNNIYNNLVKENNTLTPDQINEMFSIYSKTDEYKNSLTNYINENTIWIVLIVALIFIPLLIFAYKKYQPNFNFKLNKNILYVILNALIISIIYNLFIININKMLNINNNLVQSKYLLQIIISTGLIGPIIEELLFRGVVFNKVKSFNNIKSSILITTFIFSFFHDSISQMIYAFIVGYICINLYIKNKTLLVPIIFHIIGNIIVPIINNYLINLSYLYSFIIIILLIPILIILYKKMYKTN